MISGVFFTDIDGTLLDHDTYSWSESAEGIELLCQSGVPLVPVSSKTFAEIRLLMKELDLDAPFVFENGCGIAYPEAGDYRIETIGIDLEHLRGLLPVIEKFTGEKLLSLTDLPADGICRLTGLSMDRALLSKQRVASLPFIFEQKKILEDDDIAGLNELLSKSGAALTRGARFNHLLPAKSGKGAAVKKIIEFYRHMNQFLLTASAGDSYNDLPMFEETELAYIVRKKDGSFLSAPDGVRVTSGIGPAGFTEAVRDYINLIKLRA